MNTTFHMILIPSHVVNLENVILGRISLWPMPWAPERRQGRFFQRLLQVNPFLSSKFPGCVQKYIVYHISYGPGIYIYTYVDVNSHGPFGNLSDWNSQEFLHMFQMCYALKRKGENLVFLRAIWGYKLATFTSSFFHACEVMLALFPNLFTSNSCKSIIMQIAENSHNINKPMTFVSWLQKFKAQFYIGLPQTSWWFQPTWKICSSNWIIFPSRGENKKIFETTT